MDQDKLKRIAEQAIADTGYRCIVAAVFMPQDRPEWCVQFSDSYGLFCHDFQTPAPGESGEDKARELIVRHLREAHASRASPRP